MTTVIGAGIVGTKLNSAGRPGKWVEVTFKKCRFKQAIMHFVEYQGLGLASRLSLPRPYIGSKLILYPLENLGIEDIERNILIRAGKRKKIKGHLSKSLLFRIIGEC